MLLFSNSVEREPNWKSRKYCLKPRFFFWREIGKNLKVVICESICYEKINYVVQEWKIDSAGQEITFLEQ